MGPYFNVEFFGGHHQFSRKLYHQIFDTCGVAALKSGQGISGACQALLGEMNEQVGGYYSYALYDECTYSNPFTLSHRRLNRFGAAPGYTLWAGERGALNDYACGVSGSLFKWVDLAAVRAALHVPGDSNWFCADNGVGFVYKTTEKNLMPFYRDVMEGKHADKGLRVLVYNGDTDPSINSLAAENWTSALGFTVTEPWRAWTIDGCRQMGGYVTEYERFQFLTVRGAGHMVPEYKPLAAISFLSTWLEGEEYPRFNASCTSPPPTSLSSHKSLQGASDIVQ
jgi:serine carboxypeptidase-like clade 1